MRLLWRFLLGELVPHSLEVSGSVQPSRRDCSGDSFWGNWSHTLWRCLGVCSHPDKIALQIPSGGTGPTLFGGVWECADVWTRLLWRFLPEELVPYSLEVSGSVQTSGQDCSGDSFWRNWSHTLWRCLGVRSCLDKIALEIPSGGTGPTLSGGVWECAAIRMRLLWRFLPGELVPHSLEVSGSVQPSGRHCSGDSFWGNWSHTLWRCLGVCSHLDDIAPEIPSGGTCPTLSGGVWECAAVQTRLLQRFLPEELVPHSLEVSEHAAIQTTLLRRFLPEELVPHSLEVSERAAIWTRLLQRFLLDELVPHSLEVSGSVQPSGRHCSGDSFWTNWSHTLWRCLGVCSCPDEIALEIPSGQTGPTLFGGVWECAAVQTRLLQRFLLDKLVPHSLEVSGSVQPSR